MPTECIQPDCEALAKGVDLEGSFDDEGWPVWLVAFECQDGHNFILEFDREDLETKVAA